MNILLLTSLLVFGQSPAPTFKTHDLNLKDVISILADYDVRHEKQQPFFQPSYGATSFSIDPPTMYIFDTADHESKESTLIHELLHVYYKVKLGLDTSTEEGEAFIRQEEIRLYLQIFGDDSNHAQ